MTQPPEQPASPTDMVKVLRIEHWGTSYCADFESGLDQLRDLLESAEVGDSYTARLMMIARADFDAMPEFTGF